MIQFEVSDLTIEATAIEGEMPKRSVAGVAVPYGKAATVSDGTKVIFEEGSLPTDGKAPKLYLNHSSSQAIGIVTKRFSVPGQGMMFEAKFSKTQLAEEALQLSLDSVIDSVSVGVEPTKFKMLQDGTMLVQAADWVELSLVTGRPAFKDAIITKIAATEEESIHQPEEEIVIVEEEVHDKEQENMSAETPQVEAQVIPTSPIVFAEAKREYKMPTAGEYLAAMHRGGDVWHKVNAAYKEAVKSQQTAIEAASEQDLTSDVPGALPNPTLGPVFRNYNFVRPVVSAFGTRAMPQGNGIAFIRPTIAQHTAAGVQGTQGTQVTSQTMQLDANQVSRTTVAGSIFIAQQTMDFTDPNAMSVILDDLSGQYLKQTDILACDSLVANKQASGFTWNITSGDITTLMNAIYGSAVNISATTNLFPTHLVVDPSTWFYLGSQLDASKRPIFPAVGAPGLVGQNTLGAGNATSWSGMNPLGLELVVDGNLPTGTMLVVHAPAVEFYEAQQGMRSIENPDLLGRTFSYYGYFATFAQTVGLNPTNSQFIQAITVND
jgi:hypothetical protein